MIIDLTNDDSENIKKEIEPRDTISIDLENEVDFTENYKPRTIDLENEAYLIENQNPRFKCNVKNSTTDSSANNIQHQFVNVFTETINKEVKRSEK
ncbi:hypothetical protein C1645_813999 [Glomus cerebriforme]|uniref:Uncharacterized protein n=1 Tax=Glomus cerebriforme TaxID=658196 RepID=A0A397TI18_9GLOM|nr:hypothetical protein C1645_813999 [Glomus cerebriforme]